MKSFLEKLNKAKESIHLHASKKEEMRNNLIKFMDLQDSVRDRSFNRLNKQRSILSIFNYKPMPIIGILLLISLAGGGTSFAAEKAVPGDVLYPVKVGFNEEVKAAFTIGAEAKANWEVRRAERRLEEVSELISSGKMDDAKKAKLEELFEAHAARIKARIAQMESSTNVRAAADVASRFETSLSVHERILERIADKDNAKSLREKVHEKLKEIKEVRSEAESKVEKDDDDNKGPEVVSAASGKINAAENVISEVEKYIANKKDKLGASSTAEAEVRLTEARSLVTQAKAKFDAKLYGEAFNLGNSAIRVAQESKKLIEARTELNIEVRIKNDERMEGMEKMEMHERASDTLKVKLGL